MHKQIFYQKSIGAEVVGAEVSSKLHQDNDGTHRHWLDINDDII